MKKIRITAIFLTICLTGLAIAQHLPEGLEFPPHWRQRYEIVSEEDGLLTYRDRETGMTFVRKITPPGNPPSFTTPVDTLWGDTVITIKTWEIDTSQYQHQFRWMGTVPVYNSSSEVLVYDSDGNGREEIIGIQKILNDVIFAPNQFYEWNPLTKVFDKVEDFDKAPRIKGGIVYMGGDVDQDGYREVYFLYRDSLRVYEASLNSPYSSEYRITHHPSAPASNTGRAIEDFDGDGALEIAVMNQAVDSSGFSLGISCLIREHVSGDTGFAVTAELLYPDSIFTGFGKFAVGDFDRDGKMEIFTADVYGRVFGIEAAANDSFRFHWKGQVPTINAYYHANGGDMDGDGKPELLIGGSHGVSLPHNIITILESCEDDCFTPVVTIDIQGGWGIYVHKIIPCDIDGDGINELALDIGGWVLLFSAKEDNDYRLIWAKSIENSDGLGVGDVDNDGKDELIIAQGIWENDSHYSRSDIYTYDPKTVTIDPALPKLPFEMDLYPNYPNPFNPATRIRYRISHPQFVKLKIYDINGKEVIALISRQQIAGEYEVSWSGVDQTGKAVSSGIYIARLTAGSLITSQKLVLLR